MTAPVTRTKQRRISVTDVFIRPLLTMLAATAFLLVAWWLFLKLFNVNSFLGKTPADAYKWLFTVDDDAANRSQVFRDLRSTVRDAVPGLFAGSLVSLVIAVLFVSSPSAEQSFLPLAVGFRSVPILVLVPLLGRIFGRGVVATTIVVSIIVFFPTLVIVTHGLRSVSRESIDLMRAYDASAAQVLWKVRLPTAVPSIFAAAKVAIPSAVIGAVLAEQFVIGRGLGYELIKARTKSQFSQMWTEVFLIAFLAILLYNVVAVIEQLVLSKYAPQQGTR
jgi:ABC-type nitrate/sulfonate/bicarbonate transport system permease component